jgi:hypothetical protein
VADYTSSLMSFSAELDNIRSEAQNDLASVHQYYTTPQGEAAYQMAMNQITQGIDEGKMVIHHHSGAVDTASSGLQAADSAAAARF